MPRNTAALAVEAVLPEGSEILRDVLEIDGAVVIDLDDVALRRERLLAYAEQTRPVVVYRFVFPEGASIAAFGGGAPRDARAQLEVIVGLTGGGLAKSHGGLAARIPKVLAAKFEAMAGPLVAAYLVSLELDTAEPLVSSASNVTGA